MPKVLIIEENQRVAGILSSFLERKGHEPDIAADGISAIRSFVGKSYDLLLVNLELPFMSGDAVCRKVRESAKGKDLPIIMMSGVMKNEAEIEKLKAELRLQGFLTKPFTSEVLSKALASVLPVDRPQPAAAPDQLTKTPEAHADAASSPQQETAAEPDQPSPPAAAPVAQPRPVAAHPQRPAGRQPAPAASKLPPALKGNLESTPFEKVLFYLLKKRGTGILTASRDDVKRIFFFVHGGLLDVETPVEDEDFGSFLSKKGLVEEVELRQYRERRSQGGDPRDIFIKMGCLTPERFQEENLSFLQGRLVDCFTWTSGTVLFEWSPSFLRELSSAAGFMPLLFYRGFKAKMTPGTISAFMDEKDGLFPARTTEFYEYQNNLAAEPGAAILDLIDGRKTCAEIVNSADVDDAAVMLYTLDYLKAFTYTETPATAEASPPFPLRERTVRHEVKEQESFEDLGGALSALEDEVAALEAIKPSPAAPGPAASEGLSGLEQDLKDQWEAIKNKNYYEIFGMKQSAFSFDKCKKAYFDLTRTYGPDKFFASSSETMAMAEEFLSKVSNAYETLSNVVSKENYDEMLSQQEQVPSAADDKEFYEQIQFQSGKVFVEQGQYESAEKAFTNCLNIDPNKPEYLAYLALAIYNNPANRANPGARKRAKDMVNKSLQLGKLSIAYALKGTIYLDEGGVNFAEAEFNKALKLNPNNKTALKKLEQIKVKREEEKKGLFSKMFK